MENKKFISHFIGILLRKSGFEPTPKRILMTQILIIIVCVLGIWFFNTGNDASKYGNYEEVCGPNGEYC